jgi:ABC-type lipoprotein export system ATPase subunit
MITVSNLTFSYAFEKPLHFPDFSVGKHDHFLLLGESGTGKTTLLHLIGGLLRHYGGSVKVHGTELLNLSESSLDRFRGQTIGFIFQKNHLISALSVEKNLMMSPYLAGLPVQSERINAVLDNLGILEKRKSRITELSMGQAQRVAIARAVLNKPSIILADEPTSALDDKNCERVIDLLMNVARENQSALIVATHDQRLKDKIKNQISLNSTN